MKKSLLFLILTGFIITPAFAELTVEDTVSTDYLKNNGYSTAIINTVHKSRAQANGEALSEPVEDERYNQPVIKYVRKIFMYLDPSLDDHSFMNDHDIKTSPNYQDL